jgi:hypothetical protein
MLTAHAPETDCIIAVVNSRNALLAVAPSQGTPSAKRLLAKQEAANAAVANLNIFNPPNLAER